MGAKAIETPEQRSKRGRAMLSDMGAGSNIPSIDWLHHAEARKRLTSSERATFDLEFIKARSVAGVRASVDLALAEMRRKLMHRLGKPSWRAG